MVAVLPAPPIPGVAMHCPSRRWRCRWPRLLATVVAVTVAGPPAPPLPPLPGRFRKRHDNNTGRRRRVAGVPLVTAVMAALAPAPPDAARGADAVADATRRPCRPVNVAARAQRSGFAAACATDATVDVARPGVASPVAVEPVTRVALRPRP